MDMSIPITFMKNVITMWCNWSLLLQRQLWCVGNQCI